MDGAETTASGTFGFKEAGERKQGESAHVSLVLLVLSPSSFLLKKRRDDFDERMDEPVPDSRGSLGRGAVRVGGDSRGPGAGVPNARFPACWGGGAAGSGDARRRAGSATGACPG